MCSANRRKRSDKMAIINIAYVCCTVALLFSVNCAAQSTVKPNADQDVVTGTTVIGTTVVLETENTGDIVSTQKTAEPSPTNAKQPTTAAAASVALTSPDNSTGDNVNATGAPTDALTTHVPSESANCTENCTATTPAPVNATNPAAVTAIPTSESVNGSTEAVPVPGVSTAPGSTAKATSPNETPVQTSKPGETTANPAASTQKVTTKKSTSEAPATKKPTEPAPVKTEKPTEKAATTPVKSQTTIQTAPIKQTTTEQSNVVAKKSSGRKTATAVAITIFVVALITLLGVGYLYRQRQLRLNYGRLNEETEDGGWSAFSKNPIYRGDRDYQPL